MMGRTVACKIVKPAQQFIDAATANRGRCRNRDPQFPRHPFNIDFDAPAVGNVNHVQHDENRTAEALELHHEPQRKPQIGCVRDAKQKVWRRFRVQTAENEIARHFLVGAARPKRIGAGQINEVNAMTGRRAKQAGLSLHGDARIICNLLAAACQCIEKSCFPAVRRSDQREMANANIGANRHKASNASTMIAMASRRLMATVLSFTRTAIGSRPNKPSCKISTWAPSVKPSSMRRRSSSPSGKSQ